MTEIVKIGHTDFEFPEEMSTGIKGMPKMDAFYTADKCYPELREDLPRDDLDIEGAYLIYSNEGDVGMMFSGAPCQCVIVWMDPKKDYHLIWYTEVSNYETTRRRILRECTCDGINLIETFVRVTEELGREQWRV